MTITIVLDAEGWTTKEDFYSSYCNATNAPAWFGRNLDALADSLRGGICKITPEKIIVRNMRSSVKQQLGTTFWKDVETICLEEEVELGVFAD